MHDETRYTHTGIGEISRPARTQLALMTTCRFYYKIEYLPTFIYVRLLFYVVYNYVNVSLCAKLVIGWANLAIIFLFRNSSYEMEIKKVPNKIKNSI